MCVYIYIYLFISMKNTRQYIYIYIYLYTVIYHANMNASCYDFLCQLNPRNYKQIYIYICIYIHVYIYFTLRLLVSRFQHSSLTWINKGFTSKTCSDLMNIYIHVYMHICAYIYICYITLPILIKHVLSSYNFLSISIYIYIYIYIYMQSVIVKTNTSFLVIKNSDWWKNKKKL